MARRSTDLMTAVNVKICKIILRAHYYVKVEINEQPSLVRKGCGKVHAHCTSREPVSKEQRFICPVYPDQPVKIQSNLF